MQFDASPMQAKMDLKENDEDQSEHHWSLKKCNKKTTKALVGFLQVFQLPKLFELLLKVLIFYFHSNLACRGESQNYILGTFDLL